MVKIFNSIITIFNYDEAKNLYYSTLFRKVELQSNYKTKFTNESTEAIDFALLLINYEVEPTDYEGFLTFDGEFFITADGDKFFVINNQNYKYFLSPKQWEALNSDEKQRYFTFNSGRDFFVKGDYSDEEIDSYESFKNKHDDVFFIHSIKIFEDDLPHFEIEGY